MGVRALEVSGIRLSSKQSRHTYGALTTAAATTAQLCSAELGVRGGLRPSCSGSLQDEVKAAQRSKVLSRSWQS